MVRFDTSRLPPGVWFVRSGKGGGVMPVTPEGRRAARIFLAGMLGSGLVGGALAVVTGQLWWLGFMAVGMAGSAYWFVTTARKHGDRSINYTDILVRE